VALAPTISIAIVSFVITNVRAIIITTERNGSGIISGSRIDIIPVLRRRRRSGSDIVRRIRPRPRTWRSRRDAPTNAAAMTATAPRRSRTARRRRGSPGRDPRGTTPAPRPTAAAGGRGASAGTGAGGRGMPTTARADRGGGRGIAAATTKGGGAIATTGAAGG
jgi:hypothetical protein